MLVYGIENNEFWWGEPVVLYFRLSQFRERLAVTGAASVLQSSSASSQWGGADEETAGIPSSISNQASVLSMPTPNPYLSFTMS